MGEEGGLGYSGVEVDNVRGEVGGVELVGGCGGGEGVGGGEGLVERDLQGV